MNILKKLQDEFNLKQNQVENTVKLIDEGCTIPFIARYRKEMTGSLDDQLLRELYDKLIYLRNLDEKREQVRKLISEQEKLTDEISKALNMAETITEIDDIYRPFRPKRRTRATIAKEKGLEPLANIILEQNTKENLVLLAKSYINEEKNVNSSDDALQGAMDIIAEIISDNADYRSIIRKLTYSKGFITAKAIDEKKESVYEMYYEYTELIKQIAGHRVLAINRGEKENFISVKIEAPVDEILNKLNNIIVKLPDIEYFKKKYKNQMSNPIIKGYYTHLLTDYYWNNYAVGKYFYNLDKEKDLVKLKLQDGNEKICTWDEAVKIKQKDFSQFTNYLKHTRKMKTPIFTEKIEKYSKELEEFEYTKDDIKNTVVYIEELVQEENKEEKEEYSMFTKSELIQTLEENVLWVKEELKELDIEE